MASPPGPGLTARHLSGRHPPLSRQPPGPVRFPVLSSSADQLFAGFSPRAFTFLRGLAEHNRRDWFEAHRAEYETDVRTPMRRFIEEVDVALAERVPELTGDPRRSLFRIHRDIRFSKDKTPYKTHASCWFFHRRSSKSVGASSPDGGAAGLYFHLEPRGCYVAGGMWMPPREQLNRIRDRIVADQRGFERTLRSTAFKQWFGALSEEHMLVRLPRGYAEGHPAWRWLRFQSFTASAPLTQRHVTSANLVEVVMERFAALIPLVRWINGALGFPSADRR